MIERRGATLRGESTEELAGPVTRLFGQTALAERSLDVAAFASS